MNSSRAHVLINAQLDDSLDASGRQELSRLLADDPSVADLYAQLSLLHHSLGEAYETGILTSRLPQEVERPKTALPFPTPQGDQPRKFTRLLPWGLAAAACFAAVLDFPSQPPVPEAQPGLNLTQENSGTQLREIHDSGFAVLTRVVEPAWTSDAKPSESDFLNADTYAFASGMAQVEFLSGVSVVLEGDSSFEIISADEMKLTKGKIRAHVPPPAIGFKIHTPHGTVLDLGTEFALDLTSPEPELHVIDGEVEWHPEGSGKETLLTEGQALSLDESKPIATEADRFTSAREFGRHVRDSRHRRFSDWRAHSRELRQRPDLIAYFPMEERDLWSRELLPTQKGLPAAAIVAAEKTTGRWPEKAALDFSPNGSRVRMHLPGEFQALTFSTWARIDSLDRRFNALFLTDHYEAGEPHWQLLSDGRLFFSVRPENSQVDHHIHHSPVVWTHADSQQWLHLVTSYDCATRTARHFLNGKLISETSAPEEKATPVLRIGNAQLGNWGLPTQSDPGFAIRNLNGCLDEFAVFDTALSPNQVQALYMAGKP